MTTTPFSLSEAATLYRRALSLRPREDAPADDPVRGPAGIDAETARARILEVARHAVLERIRAAG